MRSAEHLAFAEKLRQIRVAARLSVRDVAQRIGVSAMYLSQVERAVCNPFPAFYLRRFCDVTGSASRYKEMAKLTAILNDLELRLRPENSDELELLLDLDAKLAQKSLTREEFARLKELLSISRDPFKAAGDFRVLLKFRREIEQLGAAHADDFRSTRISALRRSLDALGFELRHARQEPGVLGRCGLHAEGNSQAVRRLIYLSDETYCELEAGTARARFTLLHEVGHLLLKHPEQLVVQKIHGTFKPFSFRLAPEISAETQANHFAVAALMPAATVREVVGTRPSERLADGKLLEQQTAAAVHAFGVSFQAAQRRILELCESGFLQK